VAIDMNRIPEAVVKALGEDAEACGTHLEAANRRGPRTSRNPGNPMFGSTQMPRKILLLTQWFSPP